MLAELSHLLSPIPVVLVTGLPSPGKVRLVHALHHRLEPSRIRVRVAGDAAQPEDVTILRVHAATDFEALVEGARPAHEARRADLVVNVDWESVDRSVARVIEALNAQPAAAKAAV